MNTWISRYDFSFSRRTSVRFHLLTIGLIYFAVFVSVASIALSLFALLVPVVYEKYNKLARLAQALKEVCVGVIPNRSGTVLNLLIAYASPLSVLSTF